MIEITIPGIPVAQARPRAKREVKGVRMYDPKPSRDYKNYVSAIARQYALQEPIESALGVKMYIYRQIPKSWSKKAHKEAVEGIRRPTTKSDTSNYVKGIEDALNGIIYKDDSQICDLQAYKYYSDNPRVIVQITEVF